jgi:hypothetical protein
VQDRRWPRWWLPTAAGEGLKLQRAHVIKRGGQMYEISRTASADGSTP